MSMAKRSQCLSLSLSRDDTEGDDGILLFILLLLLLQFRR